MTAMELMLYMLPLQLPNLWAIWHAFNHTFANPAERILWMCAGVFIPFFGGVAYFFLGRTKTTGKL